MNTDNPVLFVGYDVCTIYDGFDVTRCFNCNSFNHTSATCKNNLSCPKCAENHKISECRNDLVNKCSNCISAKLPNVEHGAWDRSCPIYKSHLTTLKNNIFKK